jgi:chemotaxis signal transduction protein
MQPTPDRAGHGTPTPDPAADLEAPDFAAWKDGMEFAAPDLSQFPAWDDGPPPASVEEPVALPAVLWDGPVEEPPAIPLTANAFAPTQTEDAADEIEPPATLGRAEPGEISVEEPPLPASGPSPAEGPQDVVADWFASAEAASAFDEWLPAPTAGPAPEPEPPEAALPPLAAEQEADGEARRARLMELAAQLWTDAPQELDGAAGDPHLICALRDEEFALPLSDVLEVLRFPPVTQTPHTPDWLLGVTNRRGEILSVVDLAAFLGRPTAAPSPGRRLVVVRSRRDDLTTAFVVDRLCGLRTLPPDEMAPAAEAPFVRGACGPAAVLDLDGMLESPRLRRLESD